MKSLKKAVATLLVMALCITGVSYQKQTAKAADTKIVDIFETTLDTVVAGVPYQREFTVPAAGAVIFGVYTLEKVDFSYTILNSDKTIALPPYSISANDADWGIDKEGFPYYAFGITAAKGGDYYLELTFATDQKDVILYGGYSAATGSTPTVSPSPTPVAASLDFNSITVTKGFTGKVSVLNAGGATLTYSSSNTGVATVDTNGVVTGKKKGTAVVTVKTSNGQTLNCNVTVKDNVYSIKQLSGNDVGAGKFVVDVYKISYDKKGNLVIKTKMINKRGYKAKYLKNFKITIKNSAGKKIGVFSKKKMTVNLNTGKSKKYTFKIKKSKVKAKQDLRIITQSEIKVSGKYYYNY